MDPSEQENIPGRKDTFRTFEGSCAGIESMFLITDRKLSRNVARLLTR